MVPEFRLPTLKPVEADPSPVRPASFRTEARPTNQQGRIAIQRGELPDGLPRSDSNGTEVESDR
jgi:hypothetical protein